MKCEEFEAIGLERSGVRMSEVEADLQDAAAAHGIASVARDNA